MNEWFCRLILSKKKKDISKFPTAYTRHQEQAEVDGDM